MENIEEMLKAFNLDDDKVQSVMKCVQLSGPKQEHRQPYVVETVILQDGKSVITKKEDLYV